MNTTILRIDMTKLKVNTEPVPREYELLGGRGLNARIINREIPPDCHPLGKHNKLLISPGLLAESNFPSSGRISMGAKSPLTLGIKESNVGGLVGHKLGRLGIKTIILEGQPSKDKWYILRVTKGGVSIELADELVGLSNYSLAARLRQTHGDQIGIISIGPAGEMKMKLATIACTDMEGRPSRHAARGSLGAVMGSKGLKAVIVDDTGAAPVEAKRKDDFTKVTRDYADVINNSKSALLVKENGTLGGLTWISERNMSLPTRNFTAGSFEGARKIGHKQVTQLLETCGSKFGQACMPGCIVRCSNIILGKDGNYITSALEYENAAMLGANVGIDDIEVIAQMDRLCDDYGLDTIETGVTLGLAADVGLLKFGDGAKAIELLHEIGRGSTTGRLLGQGAADFCRAFGISRVPVVKGQGIPAHEPRVENGTGVTYCTSPQGADHTAGLVYARGKTTAEAIERSKTRQINICVIDSLGLCVTATIEQAVPMQLCSAIVNAQNDLALSFEDILNMSKGALKEEKAFNDKAGFTKVDDRLPDFCYDEPLPPSGLLFDVSDEEIDAFWDF